MYVISLEMKELRPRTKGTVLRDKDSNCWNQIDFSATENLELNIAPFRKRKKDFRIFLNTLLKKEIRCAIF